MKQEDLDRVKRILRDASPDTLALAVRMGYDPHRRYESQAGQMPMSSKQARYLDSFMRNSEQLSKDISDLFGGLYESEPTTSADAMFCIDYMLGRSKLIDAMQVAPATIRAELAYVLRVGGADPASRRAVSLSKALADLSVDLMRMSREIKNQADAHGAPPEEVLKIVTELDDTAVRASLESN